MIVLPALGLFSSLPARSPAQPPPERLVAEAQIRYVFNNADVALPVTIQGHAAIMLLGFGIDGGAAIVPSELATLGIRLADSTQLDSLTIGTEVERHLSVQTVQPLGGPGQPPVIGLLGNEFLARYDIVYDGPANRVRLYAPLSQAAKPPGASLKPWLPPGVASASCTPIVAMPEHNAGFTIQADGHPITAILETLSSYTKMNMVAARAIGLTQHSPQIHPRPASISETQDAFGHPVKYQAMGIHLTLGPHHFTDVSMLIFPELDLDQYASVVPPTLLLNPDDLRRQVLVFSNSTGQVCLGAPR